MTITKAFRVFLYICFLALLPKDTFPGTKQQIREKTEHEW